MRWAGRAPLWSKSRHLVLSACRIFCKRVRAHLSTHTIYVHQRLSMEEALVTHNTVLFVCILEASEDALQHTHHLRTSTFNNGGDFGDITTQCFCTICRFSDYFCWASQHWHLNFLCCTGQQREGLCTRTYGLWPGGLETDHRIWTRWMRENWGSFFWRSRWQLRAEQRLWNDTP